MSFPKSATDMEMARQLANVAGEPWRHQAAADRQDRACSEAIPALEVIHHQASATASWWRGGDLAVEVGNAAVPALQKRMIKMARELDRVVITATCR